MTTTPGQPADALAKALEDVLATLRPKSWVPKTVREAEKDLDAVSAAGQKARAALAAYRTHQSTAPSGQGRKLLNAFAIACAYGTDEERAKTGDAILAALASQPSTAPAGFALVPLKMTRAMQITVEAEDWQWEDLLAAAEAITEEQHSEIATAPAASEGRVTVPAEPTEAMVTAYLTANDAYWKRADELPKGIGKWRMGSPSEATAEGYRAMLKAAPTAQKAPECATHCQQAVDYGMWPEHSCNPRCVYLDHPAPAAQAEPTVQTGFEWPSMPKRQDQSPVLFEDGYDEGWARCLQACKDAFAAASEMDHRGPSPERSDLISQKAVSTLQAEQPRADLQDVAFYEKVDILKSLRQAEQPAMGALSEDEIDDAVFERVCKPRLTEAFKRHPPAAVEAAQKPVAWGWVRKGAIYSTKFNVVLARFLGSPLPDGSQLYLSPPGATAPRPELTREEIDYPRDIFSTLIDGNSPYAFYLFQWVPYQTDARRWRLKMKHDVKAFDGREAHGIWPNGASCGPFRDEEVEFIRISRKQWNEGWCDPRPINTAITPPDVSASAQAGTEPKP